MAVPGHLVGAIRLLDADDHVQAAGVIVLGGLDRPGRGVVLIHGGVQAGALIVFHPPAEAVHHHMVFAVV